MEDVEEEGVALDAESGEAEEEAEEEAAVEEVDDGGCCSAESALAFALEKKERRGEGEDDRAERRKAGEAGERWKGEEVDSEERDGSGSGRASARDRAILRTAPDSGRETDIEGERDQRRRARKKKEARVGAGDGSDGSE